MSNGSDKYTLDDRQKATADVMKYVQGAADVTGMYDGYADLELTDMKKDLTERIKTATLEERDRLNFDLALYRSLRYAAASSKRCLVLGAVNNIRELYEGMRLLYISEEDPDPPT